MPSGLPEIDSLETYGGEKSNYAPVEDSSTDESADHRNLYAMNVAAMTQTAIRAWCRFVGHAVTPTDPTSNVHGAVWGNGSGVKPTVARTGSGTYTITWPSTVTDELNEDHTVNLRCVLRPNVEGSTLYHATASVTSSNVVTVYTFNAAGSANDAAGVTIGVCVI